MCEWEGESKYILVSFYLRLQSILNVQFEKIECSKYDCSPRRIPSYCAHSLR
jgi:hypothetical protein